MLNRTQISFIDEVTENGEVYLEPFLPKMLAVGGFYELVVDDYRSN